MPQPSSWSQPSSTSKSLFGTKRGGTTTSSLTTRLSSSSRPRSGSSSITARSTAASTTVTDRASSCSRSVAVKVVADAKYKTSSDHDERSGLGRRPGRPTEHSENPGRAPRSRGSKGNGAHLGPTASRSPGISGSSSRKPVAEDQLRQPKPRDRCLGEPESSNCVVRRAQRQRQRSRPPAVTSSRPSSSRSLGAKPSRDRKAVHLGSRRVPRHPARQQQEHDGEPATARRRQPGCATSNHNNIEISHKTEVARESATTTKVAVSGGSRAVGRPYSRRSGP